MSPSLNLATGIACNTIFCFLFSIVILDSLLATQFPFCLAL
jgi:hypothetical protein